MQLAATHVHPAARRAAYGLLTAAFTAATVLAVARDGGLGIAIVFALAPDLALFLGAGTGLEKGQLHPRAVPVYNAVHRFWGPLALAVVALVTGGSGWLLAALAWSFHCSLDRTVGYGLRTADGFQRS